MRATTMAIVVAAAVFNAAAQAQWLNERTAGIPRLPDGSPSLTAPAPRAADGKPDFTGLWLPGLHPGYEWVATAPAVFSSR